MSERYCPAYGPGYSPCPPSNCDCFIDMEQAGSLHPEFYRVVGTHSTAPDHTNRGRDA